MKKKFLITIMLFFMLVCGLVYPINNYSLAAETITISTVEELENALSANDGKEIILDLQNDLSISKKINIVGKVTIISSNNAKIIRGSEFKESLISVPSGAELSLKENVTIDGANIFYNGDAANLIDIKGTFTLDGAVIENSNSSMSSPITVTDSGSMTIKSGEIRNNVKTSGTFPGAGGGAIILSDKATLTMDGGNIHNNSVVSYGGGVAVIDNATFVMNGGKISSNKVTNTQTTGGGGIFVAITANFTLNNGIIDSNTAGSGGGITVGTQNEDTPETVGKHIFISGEITNNTANDMNGGGIYIPSPFADIIMENVYIADNSASYGGGIYTCSTGNTHVYVTNGAAVVNNTASSGGNLLLKEEGRTEFNSTFTISSRILGGYSQAIYNDGVLTSEGVTNRYKDGDEEIDPSIYENNTEDFIFLHNNVKEEGISLAKKSAKLIITGNTAEYYGGGVGNNGNLDFGKKDSDKTVVVKKEWNITTDKPENIEIDLIRVDANKEETKLETVILSSENEWAHTFKDLPAEYSYRVTEQESNLYDVEITSTEEGRETTFTITNSDAKVEPETKDINIVKDWKDNDDKEKKRPESITVKLFADDKEVDRVTISAEDKWQYTFTNLLVNNEDGSEIKYTIQEEPVENYEPTYDVIDSICYITNTYTKEEVPPTTDTSTTTSTPKETNSTTTNEPKLPKAGTVATWGFVIVGIGLVALGVYQFRKKK